jgi:hypothetical protein
MQLDELPECYQTDEPFEVKEIDDSLEGRGQRRRNVVSYNDGLDDDTWALVSLIILSPSKFGLLATCRLWKREKTFKNSRNVQETRRIVVRRIN